MIGTKLNKHPEIITTKNVINDITNFPDYISHELAEYYHNFDMILEYEINNSDKIKIYIEGENLSVNWDSSLSDEYVSLQSGKYEHKYSDGGIYRVTIRGNLYKFGHVDVTQTNLKKIINFSQYLKNLEYAFHGAHNLEYVPDILPLSVTNMRGMFYRCTYFDQPLNNWQVSNVTDMYGMFYGCTNFNQPLNNWQVSNVTDTCWMFAYCTNFNQPLNNWQVSNVTDMSWMFSYCTNFNQPLNNWQVSNVTAVYMMFEGCTQLKENYKCVKR